MRRSIAWTAVSLAVVLIVPTGLASGQTQTDPSPERATANRLLYTFEHGESLTAGSAVIDSAGFADNGRVVAANGGDLTSVRHRSGHAARFPRTCVQQGCPRAIISTRSRTSLNARGHTFSFGAQVRVNENRTAFKSTVIQKGSYRSPRGRWRLRLDRQDARPYCLVLGSKGFLRLRDATGIADGHWHSLSCTRAGQSVRLAVDGVVVAEKVGPTGRVSNRAPIRVGGINTVTKNNQFFGTRPCLPPHPTLRLLLYRCGWAQLGSNQ